MGDLYFDLIFNLYEVVFIAWLFFILLLKL